MPLREVVTIELCEHGYQDVCFKNQPLHAPLCPGGRILTDPEALRALLFDADEPKAGVQGAWIQNGLSPCAYPTDDPDEIDVYVIPASMLALDPEGDS